MKSLSWLSSPILTQLGQVFQSVMRGYLSKRREKPICRFLFLFCDHQSLDFCVDGGRQDFLLHQLVFAAVGTAGNYLFGIGVSDTRKSLEIRLRSAIQIDQR